MIPYKLWCGVHRVFQLLNIAVYAADRLISTRGPHLTYLEITIPLSDSPEEPILGACILLFS